MVSAEFLLYIVTMFFAMFMVIYYLRDDVPHKFNNSNLSRNDNDGGNNMKRNDGRFLFNNGMPIGRQIGPPINIPVALPGGQQPIDPLRKFDYNVMYDDFTPPFSRSYYDDYALTPELLPYYSRGPPGRFRRIGMLYNAVLTGTTTQVAATDRYKFMILIGREKYPGREYEYYAISTSHQDKIKILIPSTNGAILNDGATITIPEIGYTYTLKVDPDLSPRYDPYW